MRTNKTVKKGISLLLCFVIVLAYTVGFSNPLIVNAASDVGANPTPAIDIAVNVPSDYPGTFLDFKQELTQKLIAQGLSPGSFRITDTKVSIDTTDLNGWYVYDHYYNTVAYNNLKLSEAQKQKQPYRGADNSHVSGGYNTIKYWNDTNQLTTCRPMSQHIYSYTDAKGKANMVFAGYGTNPLMDYMIYPASSDSRRTISFDLDARAVGAHTLQGYGFLLNAGIENGNLNGYVLYLGPSHSGGIQRLTNLNVNSNALNVGSGVQAVSLNLGTQKKARITVELSKNKVTIQ